MSMTKRKQFCTSIIIGITSILPFSHSAMASSSKSPALQLFPNDVSSLIQETGETAAAMEKGIRPAITEMETKMALYKATGCEGNDSDAGCLSIAKKIETNYLNMLNIMGDKLPQMRGTIDRTNESLKGRIIQHIGKRMSPSDLQKLTGDMAKPKVRQGRYSLSKRFEQYSRLISSSSNGNLAQLASEMYLDSAETSAWIAYMEGQIEQQKVVIKLGQLYGGITPTMVGIVDSVKDVIFGEDVGADGGELANPHVLASSHDSDLIFNQ